MSLPLPLAVCTGGVICCAVLALHLLWLAAVHRRSRPTVVSGERAFAATLAGLGGFFLVGAAAAAGYGQAWSASVRTDTLDATWVLVTRQPAVRLVSVAVFGTAVGAVVGLGFWNRRDSLDVFNIDPAAVPAAVEAAVAAVGQGDTRAAPWTVRPAAGHANVMVRWLDPSLTTDLLAVLARRLESAPTPARSAGGWYTAAAGALLGVTVALFLTFFRLTRQI